MNINVDNEIVEYQFDKDNKQVSFKFIQDDIPDLILCFSQKRSIFVFNKLIEYYPNRMNIHDLDRDYNDPNKALSVLKINDGYDNFIDIIKPGRVIHAKLNLSLLFEIYKGEDEPLNLGYIRKSPSQDVINSILRERGSICNITKMAVHEDLPPNSFGSRLYKLEWDHRVPLSKGGSNDPNDSSNWQILSSTINKEKNKICNSCPGKKCSICALAFPESSTLIIPTNQNLVELLGDD